jgi:tRNA threonylcarbamoyladenosine biosynthesis protein TsaE
VINTVHTTGDLETKQLGQRLAQRYESSYGQVPVIFALQGELGAGKTQFVKGLAVGLGLNELITSPSYTLVNEYRLPNHSNIPFVHIDAWRLHTTEDLESIGWSRFLSEKSVIALEWSQDHQSNFPTNAKVIPVQFEYGEGIDQRTITWEEQE